MDRTVSTTPAPPAVAPGPEPQPFDLAAFADLQALAPGTTLLEASAGTGKTWTIGALVTLLVGNGLAELDDLLVVTFGRAASQELRQRVRDQLDHGAGVLRAALEPTPSPEASEGSAGAGAEADDAPDQLGELLLRGDDGVRRERLTRLEAALSDIDAATIATIHQFCQQVLRSLGVSGDSDPRARLVDDVDDLLTEVVDDLYVRGFADQERPEFSLETARTIARAAVGDPQAILVPDRPEHGEAARRLGFARAVRAELERRKRRWGLLGYDDLLTHLADALERSDAPARDRMRGRWRVVLVDEFQDTDPVQWQVFDRAFSGAATMVLIGDPKQAIYAFRGGDVTTYLDAAATAGVHQTLAVNWRSDAALVEHVDRLLGGLQLGDPRIVVRPVAARRADRELDGAPVDAPLRVRQVLRSDVSRTVRGVRPLPVAAARAHVAADCAADIAALLAERPRLAGEPLHARDVAVIAHQRSHLVLVRDELAARGVRAVFAGGGSVFDSEAAAQWRMLLEALDAPGSSTLTRGAALTCFVGRTVAELADEGDAATDEVADLLRRWRVVLQRRGVAAVFQAAVAEGLTERVLARTDGERLLTDLRHLAQVLHDAAEDPSGSGSTGAPRGTAGLVAWMREQMDDARHDGVDERTRRLDSDASAVQLVTIHGSKGLEYPVVYLPFVADRWSREPDVPLFHRPDGTGSVRAIDVGGPSGPQWRESLERSAEEEAGESLRLLYVALTRARSQVVAWWFPTRNAGASPLHRALFGRAPGDAATLVPAEVGLPSDDEARARLDAWQRAGALHHERALPGDARLDDAPSADPDWSVRRLQRTIDHDWRRTSYSALASGGSASGGSAGSGGAHASGTVAEPDGDTEPEVRLRDDEADLADLPSTAPSALDSAALDPAATTSMPSPMAALPVGAAFGSLVHAVLEHAELEPGWPREQVAAVFEQTVHEQRERWPAPGLDEAGGAPVLAEALAAVVTTPLGEAADERCLLDLPAGDRLAELDFELPLAGGDDARAGSGGASGAGSGGASGPLPGAVLGDLAGLLRRHLPDGDPVLGYADALDADPVLAAQTLRGYLNGSIDAVLRVRGADGDRYLVVDYKTNWLGPLPAPGEAAPAPVAGYGPSALRDAMRGSDYPLQALLYAVVAHRFLRWRLADYDPARHLGGVLYLYLRGMAGPETPVIDGERCGVFTWHPPVRLVEELSDLLDGAVLDDARPEERR